MRNFIAIVVLTSSLAALATTDAWGSKTPPEKPKPTPNVFTEKHTRLWNPSVAFGSELTEHPDRKYIEFSLTSARPSWLNWKGSLGFWSSQMQICGSAILGQSQWRGDLGVCYGGHDIRSDNSGKYRLGLWRRAGKTTSVGLLHFSCNASFTRSLGLPDVVPRCSRGTSNKGMNFLMGQIQW